MTRVEAAKKVQDNKPFFVEKWAAFCLWTEKCAADFCEYPGLTSKEMPEDIAKEVALASAWDKVQRPILPLNPGAVNWRDDVKQKLEPVYTQEVEPAKSKMERLARQLAVQGWAMWKKVNGRCGGGWFSTMGLLLPDPQERCAPSRIVNPILWLAGCENPRDPEPEEKLLVACGLLVTAHDATVAAYERIFKPESYSGERFDCEGAFRYLPVLLDKREHSGHLQTAWERVEAELRKTETVEQPVLQAGADQLAAEKNREKPWDDKRPGFILISKARKKYCDGSTAPTLAVLGRDHCKPDGEFDYMSTKQRRKVHEEQFAAYAERQGWTKVAEAKAIALTHACGEPRSRRAKLRNKWDMKPEDYRDAGD